MSRQTEVPWTLTMLSEHGVELSLTHAPNELPRYREGEHVTVDVGGQRHVGIVLEHGPRRELVSEENDTENTWRVVAALHEQLGAVLARRLQEPDVDHSREALGYVRWAADALELIR